MTRQTKADMLRSADPRALLETARLAGNNTLTYSLADGGTVTQLHNTPIVETRPDGAMILRAGGWRTVTTKDRINAALRPRGLTLYSERGEWYLALMGDSRTRVPFAEGMTIPADGSLPAPTEEGATEVAERERLAKMILAYTAKLRGVLASGDFASLEDTGGDCWYCLMQTEDGRSMGEATGDKTHLVSHLEEGYMMGSLIFSALKWAGYREPALIWHMRLTDSIVRAVRRYLRRQLGLG